MSVKGGPNTVTSGLVLELDAGNIKSYQSGSTTWYDKSGFANNGTLINGVGYTSSFNGSLVFDGVDDYVNLNTTNFPTGANPRTISLFVKFTTFNNGWTWNWVFYYGTSSTAQSVILGIQSSTGKLTFSGYGAGYDIVTDTVLSINTWYNLTLVYNGSAFLGYVNGTLINTTNLTLNTVLSTGRLSAIPTGTDTFTGNISTTQIYNRALSADEVLQNYNATKTRFGL